MKTALGLVRGSLCALALFSIANVALSAAAQTITFKRAVQLALAHSPASAQASADEQRAFASYREAKDQYLPQFMVGSGLGDTWGYPLSLEGSAPSLFNVTAQSALFNPALRDFVRAAHVEYKAIEEETKDRRNQITQDTVLTYLEIVKWENELGQLRQHYEDALKMQEVVDQRVQAGVDTQLAGKQSQLVAARAQLRISQAQGAIDVLRTNLSQLTGIPETSLETAADSVPPLPEFQMNADESAKPEESNPAVLFAQQHAIAESFRARAEHRSLWPSADFASQYAVLAKFNNWLQFFPQAGAFQRNNATVGVVIRFPFLNPTQHAHAEAADAEAIHAKKEVESTRNQVSQQTLKLRHSVEQLKVAQKVSELEYEIAQSNVDAVQIKMNSGNATIDEGALARADLSEKYNALQDSNFELLRARVSLMRAMGELQSWVDQGK
ncbi:MAG TPA: TolC family protein [Terriglobales bacterium]|nr:TolC family protein [Terriglobales bacterium]